MRNISIIAAIASNGVIGNNGDLVWHIKKDMIHFKEITVGHTVVMGYNTYMSLKNKKPLPNRTNIILSRRLTEAPEGFKVAHNVDDVLEMTKDEPIVFIIGGGQVYKQFLPIADSMYITYIDKDFVGDTMFPDYDYDMWELIGSQEIEDDPEVDFTYYFLQYRRKF